MLGWMQTRHIKLCSGENIMKCIKSNLETPICNGCYHSEIHEEIESCRDVCRMDGDRITG